MSPGIINDTIFIMYDEQIEALISAALADGKLTEKEKQILFKRAQAQGIDLDEFEMVLDSRLAQLEKEQTATNTAAPKSEKFGDVRKCPSCGAILQSFQTTCPDCGFEFRNIESVGSAQKLFDQLQAVELRKSDKITKHEQDKRQKLEDLSRRHNSDGTLVKLFGGEKRQAIQDEEREDLIRERDHHLEVIEKEALNEKRNIIRNFPVPNTKEDLMELLAMATSNAYDNDGVIGPEEEVWIQKTDQIYQKIIVCSVNDKALLTQATNMIVSLMKRLPRAYKKFTQIPQEMRAKVQDELQREKEAKKQMMIGLIKKYGLVAGIALVVAIVSFLLVDAVEFFVYVGLVGVLVVIVSVLLFMRAYRQAQDML